MKKTILSTLSAALGVGNVMKTRTQRILLTIPFTLALLMIAIKINTILFILVNTFIVGPVCVWAGRGTKEE
ncbi:hypothetical protein ACI48J_12150 [Paenibacillus chitinolyticus]|uniref:hypothetical protein n=1 Tax=Paenibacillus chitinolyticus TaxID=79263 RepID=UPI00386647BD